MPVLAALVGLAVMVAYLFCAGPTFHWLDSGELVAAAAGLGVSHPPGHALYGLTSQLFCLLPLGSQAFRATLASAVEAGAAVAVATVLCHRVTDRALRQQVPPWAVAAASATAALVLGLSYALWLQAVRAEVYALNLLVLLVGVTLVLRWDRDGDRRYLLLAALVCGLGLGNHHFLVLLALPAVLAFLLSRRGGAGWRRLLPGMVLAGSLGLSVLVYLPLRAARFPLVSWGSATTLDRLGWLISAQAFQKTVSRAATESLEHRVVGGLFTVARGLAWDSLLGLGLGLVALLGLYVLWRRPGTRRVALLLTLLVAGNLLSPLLVGLDPYNPDAYGYLCVALAFLVPGVALVLALLFGWLAARLRRPAAAGLVAAAAALGLLGWQVAQNLPRADLRRAWAAEETARQLVRPLPPGSTLLTAYFESVFNLWALRVTGDLRPDVVYLHRNFVDYPGYVELLEGRGHPLAALARRWRAAGRVQAGDLEQRPAVYLEYDQRLGPEWSRLLQPAGLALRLGTARAGDARRHRRRVERWTALLRGELADNETRRAVVWAHYLLARWACERRLGELAAYHLSQATRVAPADQQLAALRRRCGSAQWPERPGM